MTINWITGSAILGTASSNATVATGSVSTTNCTALTTNQSVRSIYVRVENGATPPTARVLVRVEVSNDNTNFASIYERVGSANAGGILQFPFSTEHWQNMRVVIDNTGGGGQAVGARIIEGRKDIVPNT